ANLAIAIGGANASNNLVVLPPEVNTYGLLDQGIGATGSENPLDGLDALIVLRDDPTMRLASAADALSNIGTIVVIDGVLSETAKKATTVIAEGRAYASTGTYTQGDFRVQRLAKAVEPVGEATTMFNALHLLAEALGVEVPNTADAAL